MDFPEDSFDLGEEAVDEKEEVDEVLTATKYLGESQRNQNPTVLECEMCHYTTYRKFNLDIHVKRVHQLGMPKDSSTPKPKAKLLHVCDQCGKEYSSLFGLTLHKKNKHLHIFKFRCNVCEQGFNQSVQYKHHCAQHLNFNITKCDKCGKTLKGHSSLKRHQALACEKSDNKKGNEFPCDECFKVFASKDRLKSHQKGMHGPERYLCVRCGKSYRWRSSLKTHQMLCK